jgi:hypothetical protein
VYDYEMPGVRLAAVWGKHLREIGVVGKFESLGFEAVGILDLRAMNQRFEKLPRGFLKIIPGHMT